MKIVVIEPRKRRVKLSSDEAHIRAAVALITADDNVIRAAPAIARIFKRAQPDGMNLDEFIRSVVQFARSTRERARRLPLFPSKELN